MGMKGKNILVTGAARSIGRACAERFAEEGCNIAIVDMLEEVGQKTVAEIAEKYGVKTSFYKCDVGFKVEVDTTIDQVVEDFGHIDVLVSNAGIQRRGDFLDITEEQFDDVIRTNLKSMYLFGQKVGRHMVARGKGGAIVNMSSTSVRMTMPGISPYATSKGGVSALTNAMALSLAPHGIRVNAVGPGTIVTDLSREGLLNDKEARRKILTRIPMRRLGQVRDVAGPVFFLASDDSSYMTGETIFVDGGRSGLNYNVEIPDDILEKA
jgi:NAD(P)-dependent dehydrogenase (short-subunit alcohol dehydrogenase family)|tara:strand:- start:638 stop:1438 length:801 start_codon:yes stop_codon:yes gene_type:complete